MVSPPLVLLWYALVLFDCTLWKGIVVQGVCVGKEACPRNVSSRNASEKVFKKVFKTCL